MPTIQYILFDLGFVLVELNGLPWFKQQYPNLSDTEIHRRWVALDCVQQFETGKISEQDFFAQAVKELNLSASPSHFSDIFKQWVVGPYQQTEDLLTKLSGQYTLGCLSNTNSCHIEHLKSISSFLELFDHRFYSHEIGVMKPDALAYQIVIESLGIEPQQILFIDDSHDNVKTAQQLGIQAFQAKGIDDVLQCLELQLALSLK